MQTAAWVQAISAVLTLFSAIAAAWIASRVPRWAEEHRSRARAAEQTADLQRLVLISLLKGRSAMLQPDTLAAINLVDVAFLDSHDVRQARLSFITASAATPFSADRLVERFHGLIIAVVREMGINRKISPADIQQGYYPNFLGRLDEAALAEAEEKIARRATAVAS